MSKTKPSKGGGLVAELAPERADRDVLTDILWTEKYRPTSLEDMALEPETRAVLQAYLAAGEVPHLLLVGPPGSGKTTVARILIQALDCHHLTLNASAERGIDTVREKVGSFVTAITDARWNIVFLDEADALTNDAQTALRNMIESYADRSRFLLTANYQHRIIGPIQSRCQLLTLGRPPLKERVRILLKVLKAEELTAEPTVALAYAERFSDLRQMLWHAQQAFLRKQTDTLPILQAAGPVDGVKLFSLLSTKNWTGLRQTTASGEFDPQQGLRELFYAVPNEHPQAGFLRHVLGRGVHEMGFTPDPVVLFLGVCAEAMERL
jgi:replication factor C small subunit